MLQRLSSTSPYICDLTRGPIEPANRMASTSTNKITNLLESKDIISKARTPLKLLAHDEIPMDTTMAANDINASLQPIWYTEQTIVDEHPMQNEQNSIIQEKSRNTLPRSTLPPIKSESPLIDEEDQLPVRQPSLMHKSSTFTVESSMNVESALNELEKENLVTDETIPAVAAPSDESFRALEHLLGLGSATTSMRESPKPSQDTLSLTVVTPTEIVNSTRRSSRLSTARKTITDNLPSSQEIPKMPTIESITSVNPPSFLADNSAIADEQPSIMLNQQDSFDLTENSSKNDDESNFSFELNDFTNSTKNESVMNIPEPVQPPITMRAPTCTDVALRALIKPRTNGRISQPIKADSPLAMTNKGRSSAPAPRFLRSSCRRISNDSASQNSTAQEQPATTNECFIDNDREANTEKQENLIEMVSVPEEDEIQQEKSMSITLNLNRSTHNNETISKQVDESYQSVVSQQESTATPTKPLAPLLSREYTYNTPTRSSQRHRSMLNASTKPMHSIEDPTINVVETESPSIVSKSMLNVLLTQPTEQTTLSPMKTAISSPSIVSKSMLGVLLTQPTETKVRKSTRKSRVLTPVSSPRNTSSTVQSPSIVSKSMLGILLTKPTQTEDQPLRSNSKILTPSKSTSNLSSTESNSMLGVLLTQSTNNEQSILQDNANISIDTMSKRNSERQSKRFSTNLTPRVSINPLHSSTPSMPRQKSIQMVSIGEEEQVLTTVPTLQEIEIIPIDNTNESIQQTKRTIDTGVQTTPSLNYVSRRYFDSLDQDSSSIFEMNKSTSSVTVQEKEITPSSTKLIMNLKRNVRFQLTPTTDARLTEKERLEEALRGLKPDVIIDAIPIVVPQNVKSDIKKPVKRLKKKSKAKKNLTIRKKKSVPIKKSVEIKQQLVKSVSPKKNIKAKIESTTNVSRRKRTGPEMTTEPIATKRSKPTEVRSRSAKAPITSTTNNKVDSKKSQRSVTKMTEKKKIEPKKQKSVSKKIENVQSKRSRSQTKKTEQKSEVKVKSKRNSAKVKKITPNEVGKLNDPNQIASKRTASKTNSKTSVIADIITTNEIPEVTKRTRSASAKNKEIMAKEFIDKVVIPSSNEENKIETVESKQRSSKSNKKTKVEEITSEKMTNEQKRGASTTKNNGVTEVDKQKRNSSITNQKGQIDLSNERLSRAQSRSANKKPEVVQLTDEKLEGTSKSTKRRAEKKEAEKQSVVVQSNQEQKFDELTVVELKSRLTKHKEDIPKGAKKADLIALLIKKEASLIEEQKPIAKTTRRHKK